MMLDDPVTGRTIFFLANNEYWVASKDGRWIKGLYIKRKKIVTSIETPKGFAY